MQFVPEPGPSAQDSDMASILCSELWPSRIRIQPRLVPRPDTAESESQDQKQRPPELRPVEIPLDIYLVILEHCSKETLRTVCLVSKLSYHYAAPLLWKDVDLTLKEERASRFTNALRDIVKRHGKHVETIGFGFFVEERFEESPWARPIEAATSTLVELAIEQMPKLRSFTWGSYQTPSNEMIDALKARPRLQELTLDSDGWNMSLVTELNFGGFRHLTSFTMEGICDDSQVLAIRHILDTSLSLRKLKFGFVEYFWEEWEPDTGVDVFDVLFSKDAGQTHVPGGSLEELMIVHGLFNEHSFKPSFLKATELSFRNLSCLTLHHFSPHEPLSLGPGTLRLRELRIQCSSWQMLRPLLEESTKLELLHIKITTVGFEYDDLIPLVCKSGETLRDLRLEWEDNIKRPGEQEIMCKDSAWTLASKCSKIRHLSLRADFDLDAWCHIEAVFPGLFVELTHFKLQRQIPKERSKPPTAPGPSSKPPKDPATATKQQLSIDFLTGTNNGIKYPETTAGDFFTVFIMAANNDDDGNGGGGGGSGGGVTSLKYVGIDGHVYELHVFDGVFTFSEVPAKKVHLCGGPFVRESKPDSDFLRLAAMG